MSQKAGEITWKLQSSKLLDKLPGRASRSEPASEQSCQRAKTTEKPIRYPSLYQIDTRVWLTAFAQTLGRPETLNDIPDAELD
jgi:hypothetical protein